MTSVPLLRRIVELVHDLPPDERRRVLERECGADLALRAEVERLLGAAELEPEFLTPPTLPRARDLAPAPELAADTRIEGFRLIARIATGGMGTVWEAEQGSPRRRVALKTLRAGDLSDEAVRRFRHESEILARLRHPSIAQIFAAGVHVLPGGETLPWYALEYVDAARSLTEFARGLALSERLALFARLCDAIQHSHQRGVIHRDLKPSNVLVDGSGQLKVIDFGVARVREQGARGTSFQTGVGRVLGTLQYMAPEQLAGSSDEIDAQSDVYALGVMLYELVTGELPYDLSRVSLAEAARVLAEQAPRRPGALSAELSADVDAIALTALEKDRTRRYPSAAALAADVRRFLGGEPVLARPPSAAHHLWLFARRHRVASAALAATVLVSVAAAAVSLHYAWRAGTAERLATRRFEDVRGLARSMLYELHDSILYLPGATEARRNLAATALEYLDALEREAGDDTQLLEELAEGRLRLGEVLGAPGNVSLGDREAGARELERALAVSERLLSLRPDAAARALRARVLLAQCAFERASGRPERALELVAVCSAEAVLVAQEHPELLTAARLLQSARSEQAEILELLGRSDEALALQQAGVEGLRPLRERWPDSVELWRDSAILHMDLGAQLLQRARAGEAVPVLDEGLACAEEHRRRAPEDVRASGEIGLVLTWRGSAHADMGDFEAAQEDFQGALEMHRELLHRDPQNSTAMGDLAFTCQRLGSARMAARDFAGALEAYAEALELSRRRLERAPGGFDERVAVGHGEMLVSEALVALQRPEEARSARARGIEMLRALESEHPGSLEVLRHLATALSRAGDEARVAGRFDEALERYAEAAERIESAAQRDPAHAWTRRMVMVLHCWRGVAHKAAAEQAAGTWRAVHYEEAVQSFEAALSEQPELARAGFLKPGDERAVELVSEDLETCRLELAGSTAP